MFIAQRQKLKR